MPGVLTRSKYLADDTKTYAISIHATTIITTYNPAPTGTIDGTGTVYAHTGNRRKRGLHARYAAFKWTDPTTPGTGYFGYGYILLPILTPTAYAALTKATTFTYQGASLTFVYKEPERDKR